MSDYNELVLDGKISVQIQDDEKRVHLTVTHHGLGISVNLPGQNLYSDDVQTTQLTFSHDDLESLPSILRATANHLITLRESLRTDKSRVIDDQGRRWPGLAEAAWSIGLDPTQLDGYIMTRQLYAGRTYSYV